MTVFVKNIMKGLVKNDKIYRNFLLVNYAKTIGDTEVIVTQILFCFRLNYFN